MTPELIKIGIWALLLNEEGSGYAAITQDCEYNPHTLLNCTWLQIPEELELQSRGPWKDLEDFKGFLNWAHRVDPKTTLWEY